MEGNKKTMKPIPKEGDNIYVSDFSPGNFLGDYHGGKATVSLVEKIGKEGEEQYLVKTLEHPGLGTNWNYLGSDQDELEKQFGDTRASYTPHDLYKA